MSPGVDRTGELEDAVRQRRLAVVDVADDGEVADALDGDGSTVVGGRRHSPSIVPAAPPVPDRLARELVRPGGSGACWIMAATCYSWPPHRWAPALPPPPFENRGFLHVANIKSQIKRNRQNEKRRLRNKSVRAELRTRTKSAVTAAEVGAEDSVGAAAPGREADRQGGGPRCDPQEHGGQPQVAPGAPGGRDRDGRRRVAAPLSSLRLLSRSAGGALQKTARRRYPMWKVNSFSGSIRAPMASALSSHSSNDGPCLGRYSSSIA